jgi:hypothetical protein
MKGNSESEVRIDVTFVLIKFSYMKLFKPVDRKDQVFTFYYNS